MSAVSVVGIDVARRHDYAAAVHLAPATNPGCWRVVRAEQIPHTEYARLSAYAAHLADLGAAVAIDATGVGAPVLEDIRARTDTPIWGVTIHGGRKPRQPGRHDLSLPKRGLIEHGRRMCDTGALVIPQSAPGSTRLISQLAALAPIARRGRRPALEARHGHDDVALAGLIAAWMT